MLRDRLAKLAKRTSLCEVRLERDLVRKRRSAFGNGLAHAENLVLIGLQEPVRVLLGNEWHARELIAWEGHARVESGWLIVPRRPGPTLTEALRSRRPSDKADAFTSAWNALAALHERGLSHGDATSDNVCVNGVEAGFFDFEQAHVEGTDPAMARADDLVTLVFSALTSLAVDERDPIYDALDRALEPARGDESRRTRRALADFARAHPDAPPFLHLARIDGRGSAHREVALRLAAYRTD